MAEFEEQTKDRAADVSDETLRQYLLGRLGEDERLELDQHLLFDDSLAERILLCESELIDDFVAQRLPSRERELFTQRFLVTESRKQKLRLASALRGYADSQSRAGESLAVSSWRERVGNFFGFELPPVWALAGSFAVLMLLVGLTWFALRRAQPVQVAVTRQEPVPALSPASSSASAPSPPVTSTPPVKTENSPTPVEPVMPTTVASFVLLPGAVRDGGDMTRISVPRGERDVVRLTLSLEADTPGLYRAELATAEGQKVTVRDRLKARITNADAKVTLDIPARLLKHGDYQIVLSRQKPDGQTEGAGRYYFRALEQ